MIQQGFVFAVNLLGPYERVQIAASFQSFYRPKNSWLANLELTKSLRQRLECFGLCNAPCVWPMISCQTTDPKLQGNPNHTEWSGLIHWFVRDHCPDLVAWMPSNTCALWMFAFFASFSHRSDGNHLRYFLQSPIITKLKVCGRICCSRGSLCYQLEADGGV